MVQCKYNKEYLQQELKKIRDEIDKTNDEKLKIRLRMKMDVIKNVISSYGDRLEHSNKVRDGSDYCLFHDPDADPEQIKVEFDNWIRSENEDENVREIVMIGFRIPSIDLSGFSFKKPIISSLSKFDSVVFNYTKFMEKADFNGATFEIAHFNRAVFKRRVSFISAMFKGADFNNAKFSIADFDGVIFDGAIFTRSEFDEAYFNYAVFRERADFTHSKFKKAIFIHTEFEEADFDDAKFELADFNSAKFEVADFDRAVFESAIFTGSRFNEADFDSAEFEVAHFNNAKFIGRAAFIDAKFRKAVFARAEFEIAEFEGALFMGKADFTDTIFKDTVTFKKTTIGELYFSNISSKLTKVYLRDIIFSGNNSKIVIDNCLMDVFSLINLPELEDHKRVVIKNPIFDSGEKYTLLDSKLLFKLTQKEKDDQEVTLDNVLGVYRRLRKNLDSKMFYDYSGKLFIEEMRLVRSRAPWYEKIFYLLYDWLALYGESMIRPLLAIISTIVLFALLIGMLEYGHVTVDTLPQLLEISAKNFFQVGNYEKTINFIERLVAIPIVSMWIIALRRRLERRIK